MLLQESSKFENCKGINAIVNFQYRMNNNVRWIKYSILNLKWKLVLCIYELSTNFKELWCQKENSSSAIPENTSLFDLQTLSQEKIIWVQEI